MTYKFMAGVGALYLFADVAMLISGDESVLFRIIGSAIVGFAIAVFY